MEQFNHKIFKLRKEIVDITFDLNKFKKKNHKTITKILDNLNTIQEKKNTQKVNKTITDNFIKSNKDFFPNKYKKNLCYTKKSISLEKNNQYPFNKRNKKNDQISLSANNIDINLNDNKHKRSISSYLTNNYKKVYINNEKMIDLIFEDKTNNKIQQDKINKTKNNCTYLFNKYHKNSIFNIINDNESKQNIGDCNKYKTIDNRFLFDKENKNIISNYKDKKFYKDNIINIYSYNHNSNISRNKPNNNYLYKKTLSNIENEEINIHKNKKDNNNLNINDYWKTLQNINIIEPKTEIIDLNTMRYHNKSNKINNNIVNDQSHIDLNNNSKQKSEIFFKKHEMKNNIISNTQSINSFREKLLTDKNKNCNFKNNITNDKNNIYNNKNNNINLILKDLDAKDFEEAKIKIKKLMNCQKFFQQINNLFYEFNEYNENNNLDNILYWIYDINTYSPDFNYKQFFEDIMNEHKIKDFEELKNFINNNYIIRGK